MKLSTYEHKELNELQRKYEDGSYISERMKNRMDELEARHWEYLKSNTDAV